MTVLARAVEARNSHSIITMLLGAGGTVYSFHPEASVSEGGAGFVLHCDGERHMYPRCPAPGCAAFVPLDVPARGTRAYTHAAYCPGASTRAGTEALQSRRVADDVVHHIMSFLSCSTWRS